MLSLFAKIVLLIFIVLGLGLVMWPLRIALVFSGLPHWIDSLIVAAVAVAFVISAARYLGLVPSAPTVDQNAKVGK